MTSIGSKELIGELQFKAPHCKNCMCAQHTKSSVHNMSQYMHHLVELPNTPSRLSVINPLQSKCVVHSNKSFTNIMNNMYTKKKPIIIMY